MFVSNQYKLKHALQKQNKNIDRLRKIILYCLIAVVRFDLRLPSVLMAPLNIKTIESSILNLKTMSWSAYYSNVVLLFCFFVNEKQHKSFLDSPKKEGKLDIRWHGCRLVEDPEHVLAYDLPSSKAKWQFVNF